MANLSVDASRWKLINSFIVLCLSLWGMAAHKYTSKKSTLFESYMIETFAPIQRGTLGIKEYFASIFNHYILIINTSEENVRLKAQTERLRKQLFDLSEIEKENARLKQLLDFGKEIQKKKILAQIVGWDSSNEFKVLRINKGANDGIKTTLPVITVNGLVGYVYRVTPNFSDILTILDQNNRVDAIVANTRAHGVVEGVSDFKCRLKYVIRTEKVSVGNEIITAGLGNIYPKGIKIGTISRIDKENYGITQSIEVSPSVDFHKLEEVVVLAEDKLSEDSGKKETASEK